MLTVIFGTADAEHLCQISWKSDFYFSRNQNERNERTNEPTNKQTRLVEVTNTIVHTP